jgi:hypothetical protein
VAGLWGPAVVTVLGLILVAALSGGLGGMRLEEDRRNFTDRDSAEPKDWI